MTSTPTQHGWSKDALFNKALLYVGEMERYAPDDWQHRLWASLSLELLARASVASISPTLLADRANWRNVYHALGHPPTAKRFAPMSIKITEVFAILGELCAPFTKELLDSCIEQCGHRNAELHSGEDAISGTGTSTWLPQYYASCQTFLEFMGMSLKDLFKDPQLAEKLILSLKDTAAQSVKKDIHDHSELWQKKDAGEQEVLKSQAEKWASRRKGHRSTCPSCGCQALLRGSPQGDVSTDIRSDLVVQKQTMLPSGFECVACDLKIGGFSKLSACGLGDAFVSTTTLSPAEYFGLYTEQDLDEARASASEPEYEPDFNEY